MKIKDFHAALTKAIEAGHEDAQVCHVNGQGKATQVTGWQLVTSAGYDHGVPRGEEQQLRLYTQARF